MHTLHYFIVEAPDKEEAFSEVSALLEPSDDTGYSFPEWSDWHVVGGGRWKLYPMQLTKISLIILLNKLSLGVLKT
jgi:hypothetical protein